MKIWTVILIYVLNPITIIGGLLLLGSILNSDLIFDSMRIYPLCDRFERQRVWIFEGSISAVMLAVGIGLSIVLTYSMLD